MAKIVPEGTTFNDIRVKVKEQHVESALEYLIKHGFRTEKGILYDINEIQFQPKSVEKAFQDKGHSFGVKAIVRVAYLYSRGVSTIEDEHLKEVYELRNNSSNNSSRWSWMSAKALLKGIGFSNDEADDKNITLDDIKREHVEKALDYILQNSKEKNGLLYVDHPAQVYIFEYDKKKTLVEEKFGYRETFRLAFLDCAGIDVNSLGRSEFHGKYNELMKNKKRYRRPAIIRRLKELGAKFIDEFIDEKETTMTNEMEDKAYDLLMQFYQIIFHGPPGTGKTYAAKNVIAELLNVDREELSSLQGEGGQWDIVQFHPSYNYEDFVRGVKVTTTKDKNVAYTTENRIFGIMCEQAKKEYDLSEKEKRDPKNYVLIIDEINRANVSAVLGELIYALEYRGEKIKTPYIVDGDADAMLIIPKNLYVIGTMNNADRTIGQIDYAVRRRFAFVHCPPSREIIKEHVENERVWQIYDDVQGLFEEGEEQEYLSQDYDAEDVRIGHSYFLHDAEIKDISHDMQISQKIIYQVIPILREYVKDGVLLSEAEDEINEIEKEAKRLSSEDVEDKEQDESSQNRRFSWKNGERNSNGIIVGMRRTVLSIVKDFVEDYKEKNGRDITIEELREWFPDKAKHTKYRGIKLKEDIDTFNKDFFFMKEGDELKVDGKIAYVTKDWGDRGTHSPGELGSFHDFKEKIEEKGYKIDEIEKEAKILSGDEVENEGVDPIYEEEDTSSERGRYFWEKDGRHSGFLNKRKIVLSIVRDYVGNNPDITVEELKAWFPDKAKHTKSRGIKLEEEIDFKSKGRFFMIEGLKVEGKVIYVTNQWGAERHYASGERGSFEDFREAIKKSGYLIRDENELEEEK